MRLILAMLMVAGAVAAQELPENAVLVGEWSFDDGEGQWAADAGPFGHGGVLGSWQEAEGFDPEWAAEGEGGCLRFDGEGGRVTIAHAAPLAPVEGLVFEARVMQTARSPYARVADKGSTFELYVHENGRVHFRLHGAEAHGVTSSRPIPLDEWVTVRAELAGGTMRLLFDGEIVAERAYADPPQDASQPLRIGSAQNARPFAGLIDEVRLWNVGYEPPEGLDVLQADAGTVGLWHLDAAPIVDASGTQPEAELVAGEIAPGRHGNALRLSGDGWARVPDDESLDLTDELCIEAWVYQEERVPYSRVVEKSDWTWGLWIDRFGYPDFFFKTADGGYHHTVGVDEIPLRQWTHLRGEFDGFHAAIYVNGVEVARDLLPAGQDRLLTSARDLYLGNRYLGDRGLVGMLDEVRISRRIRGERPPVKLIVTPWPSEGVWQIRASARGADGEVARMTGRIERPDGSAAAFDVTGVGEGIGAAEVATADPPPGAYAVVVEALGEDGTLLGQARRELTVPETPWLGAGIGLSDAVPPPWTPMRSEPTAAGAAVECWGRRYELAGGALPASIASAGAELLAGACRLVGDGAQVAWQAPEQVSAGDASVRLNCAGELGASALAMVATVEFDGMARYDFTLTPPEGGTTVGPLALEVPLRAEHATLMHHPGQWFLDETCAGAVPAEGWSAGSTWYLWAGDEDRGLCWFAEDQASWGPDAERPGIELAREGERTVMRVWLLNAPAELTEPRTFTWGLMATPVKPLPEDAREWRFGSPSGDTNVAVFWSLKNFSEWHSFPVPVEPEEYQAMGEEAHERGQRIVPYTNFNMQSDLGEAWEYFGGEWYAHAGQGRAADVLRMGVVNMRCCPLTQSWQDFITWTYKRFLDEYDWDGFYLDNSIPGRCNNPHHSEEHYGRRLIFGTRELMKRFYTLTKANDPRNVMVCHMSAHKCIPLLSFCDATVDGEQYSWALEHFDGDYINLTSLARVRAELMASNWGPISLFLPAIRGSDEHRRVRTRELLALLLPHDVRFWAGGSDPETLSAALDALDGFRIADARFVPYWADDGPRVTQEDAIASAYVREGEGALVVVANLADEERAIEVRFNGRTLTETIPARDFAIVRAD